jgi:hypothetical protein
MNDQYMQKLSELEREFTQELKGEGSLSPRTFHDSANFSEDTQNDEGFYVGYDIHPENLEALFFEGLKLPRWESIKAESVAQQEALYRESLQKTTLDYPLISRVTDTDQKISYTPEEVVQLREECKRVLDATNDTKAVKALQKFYIACNKAVEQQMGLLLIPSH